jgi:hypothetical protein
VSAPEARGDEERAKWCGAQTYWFGPLSQLLTCNIDKGHRGNHFDTSGHVSVYWSPDA